MAFPSYTYTFSNGTTADAAQVDQNFSDILNGISDTTKDISVAAVTAAGTTNLKGAVVLGASGSNDITFNGSIASSIPVKTNTSFDIGSATLGLRSVYIGGTSTFSTRILGAATASWTLTLPTTAGTGGQFLQTDGSGVSSWANVSEPKLVTNLGLAASVATNALTIALKTSAGADPSGTSPVSLSFRNATSATGQYASASQSAALSIVVPSSATLGQTSAVNQYVWVYLINDAGTLDLAVSGVSLFDENTTQSSTQISSSATSGTVLYSSTSHSGAKPIRLIGRLLVNEATAGTWASAPSELALLPTPVPNYGDWQTYTLTVTGSSANPTLATTNTKQAIYRREGDSIHMKLSYSHASATGAANGTGTYLFAMPSGVTANSTFVTIGTTFNAAVSVGFAGLNIGTSVEQGMTVQVYDTSHLAFQWQQNVGAFMGSTTAGFTNTTVQIYIEAWFPVTGWSTYGP